MSIKLEANEKAGGIDVIVREDMCQSHFSMRDSNSEDHAMQWIAPKSVVMANAASVLHGYG
jgi:hypothetical protein